MKKSLPNVVDLFRKKKNEQEEYLNDQEDVIEELVKMELIDHILKDDDHFVELVIWAAEHEEEILSVDLDSQELLLLNSDDMYVEYSSEKTAIIISSSLSAWKERHEFYEDMCRLYEEKQIEKYPEEEMVRFKQEIEEKAKPMPLNEWTRRLARYIISDDEGSREFVKKQARQMKDLDVYLDTEYATPSK